ncbi:MAG: AI-2E family transporter, partial [Acidimicrobiia bacterium]
MASAEQRADDRLTMRRALVVALALLLVSFGLFISWTLRNLLSMILVSVFVAVAFEPPVHFLVKRGWKRGLATGAVFVAAFLLALGFISALAPLAIEQVRELIASIPEILAGLREWLVTTFALDLAELEVEALSNDLLGYFRSVGGTLAGGLLDLAAGIGGVLIFATTVVLFSFYIVADLPQLRRTVLSAMPEKEQRKAVRVWDIAVENMGGYIYSRLLLAVLSAALTTIVLTILDIPFALSLGIWVGVLSQFVPVIGTYLAAVLPAVVALTFNDVGTAVIATIYFIGYQQ